MSKNILLIGASGMTGSLILDICLKNDQVDSVFSIARKPSNKQHDKLTEVLVADIMKIDADHPCFKNIDVAFFCVGVYTGAVPRETFREITVEMPVSIAEKLHTHSPEAKFCLLSGAGADRTEKSNTAFAKDKGAAENQLAAIGFKAFHSFRPGYIYPVNKRIEPNFSYRIFRTLYPLIRLFGKNASIKSTELAQGMFNVGINDAIVQEVFENRDILQNA